MPYGEGMVTKWEDVRGGYTRPIIDDHEVLYDVKFESSEFQRLKSKYAKAF